MKLCAKFLIAGAISSLISMAAPAGAAAADSKPQITILYDAFGTDASMSKDWGFSALVEIAGKRILFDTGNDADIFSANVEGPALQQDDLTTYRRLARREDPFGILHARSLRTKASQL